MNKILKIMVGAALLTCVVAGAAFAGDNAGATGKLAWLDATNKVKPGTNEMDCLPKMGMTATGLTRFRGADVQLYINGASGNLPPSWQWWIDAVTATVGCADGQTTYGQGFRTTGAAHPPADSIYNAFTGVPGLATGQGAAMYYNVNPCLTPHNVGLIWFAAAGTGAVVRPASKTFGLFSLIVNQNSGCPGGCSQVEPVCINVAFRQPCSDPANPRGTVFGVTDSQNKYDYLSVAQSYLTWGGTSSTCPGVTAVKTGTWGQLKKAYR